MENIIMGIVVSVLAVTAFVFGLLQLLEKGKPFNNTYLFASEKERQAIDKKPLFRQTGIVLLLIAVIFAIDAVQCFFKIGWLFYLVLAVAAVAVIYAVVSSVMYEKRGKK